MLIERNPNDLYRSHYVTTPTAKRIAILMRLSPTSKNTHVHWFCTPQTARAFFREMQSQAATCEMAARLVRKIRNLRTVSFDPTIDHIDYRQPPVIVGESFDVEWKKTWPTSKFTADTGPRPARKSVEQENPRQIIERDGSWFEYADTEERPCRYDTPHLAALTA